MQVGSNCVDRQTERQRDLRVALLFLMIEDEHGSFDVAQAREFFVDGGGELAIGKLLLRIAAGMYKTILPTCILVGERGEGAIRAAAAFPFVLSDIDGYAIEKGGEEGVSAEAGQRAIEPKKDLLREVLNMLAGSGQTQKCAEDGLLVIANDLLEVEVGGQVGSDCETSRKFRFLF